MTEQELNRRLKQALDAAAPPGKFLITGCS